MAAALLPVVAGALLEYADALALSRNRDLGGEPYDLIKRALQLNPQLPKALAMAGAAEFAQGRFDAARGYWTKLLAALPPDSPDAAQLKEMLAQLDLHTGVAAGKAAGGAPALAQAAPAIAPAQQAPPAAGATASGKSVAGTVRIAPALAALAAPDATLFVYARAADGPRMPLAIVRAKARELPFAFRLDDSMAMAGGAPLSSIAQLRIEARISKSGQAMPQTGDLRGESAVVAPGAAGLDIVIDKVVN
jgi:cytochrome c-type biogenesis protein CcmH